MELKLGFALCGSFCTMGEAVSALERAAARYDTVLPILSEAAAGTDTRFGRAEDWRARVEAACGRPAVTTVAEAEPIGPRSCWTCW